MESDSTGGDNVPEQNAGLRQTAPPGAPLPVGTVVRNKNGRDAGTLFFVVGAEDGLLLLADGRGRLLEKPKRKKPKHVAVFADASSRTSRKLGSGEKVTNAELRRALAAAGADDGNGGV
ncbi:MAG: KOW domain-containing RNA-binding protein [Oscillospiraceae bacterium]|jgi:ribosomal protein L14E/L6E/L27E|nr:KOW domain-containing RNA-binding protein [Oscillospiraceae bacterium]